MIRKHDTESCDTEDMDTEQIKAHEDCKCKFSLKAIRQRRYLRQMLCLVTIFSKLWRPMTSLIVRAKNAVSTGGNVSVQSKYQIEQYQAPWLYYVTVIIIYYSIIVRYCYVNRLV